MTANIETDDGTEPAPKSPTPRLFRFIFCTIGAVFCALIIFGYSKAASEHGAFSPVDIIVVALLALAGMSLAWFGLRGLRGALRTKEPLGPRSRLARQLLWASVGLGVLVGIVLAIVGWADTPGFYQNPILSDSPLSGVAVAVLIAGWIASLAISAKWHLTIDEHEQAAYNFGGMLSLYGYVAVTVGWWLLWRAGFLGEPDAMVIFLGVTAVWMIGWVWKRSR